MPQGGVVAGGPDRVELKQRMMLYGDWNPFTKTMALTEPPAERACCMLPPMPKLPSPSMTAVDPDCPDPAGRTTKRWRQQPGTPLDGYCQKLREFAGTPKPPPIGAV